MLRRWAAFLIVGLVNTAASYATYLALRQFMPYQAAYGLGFMVGVAISAVGNSAYVFGNTLDAERFARFAAGCVLSWACSAALLHAAVEWLALPAATAPLLVIVAMIPVNYGLARLSLRSAR
jgi:putative flippase GtrA